MIKPINGKPGTGPRRGGKQKYDFASLKADGTNHLKGGKSLLTAAQQWAIRNDKKDWKFTSQRTGNKMKVWRVK